MGCKSSAGGLNSRLKVADKAFLHTSGAWWKRLEKVRKGKRRLDG